MSLETETACWGAQACKLDPNCADYGYQCKAQADREAAIRADERAKVADEIASAIEAYYVGHDKPPMPAGRRELIEKVAKFSAAIAREIGGAK